MSQTIIREKLITHLATWAAAHDPVLKIAREGASFTKPTDGSPFLEAFIIPANTTLSTLDGTKRRFLGDFQINVWTRDSIGAGEGEAIAEELSLLFPVVPKTLSPVSIEAPANIKRAMLDSGWRITPIILSYRMEAEN